MSAPKSGPTTYGQLSVLRSLEVHGPGNQAVANLVDVWEIPPGADTGEVIGAWLGLVQAHESLRTTYDRSGERPLQIVRLTGFRKIPTVEVDEDSVAAVREVAARWAAEPISTEDLPWRAFVATYLGEPCCLAVVVHHVAADNGAFAVLEDHFRRLLSGDPLGAIAQPLDLADEQQRASGSTARSLAYWTESWDRIVPQDRDPSDASVRRRASVYSTTALAAAQHLSERLRVSAQAVLLGAGALALARLKQREQITLVLMAANRFNARWASLVSSLNQYAPITIDVDEDASPDDFLRDAYMQSLGAYMHAGYDVDALRQRLNRAGHKESDPTAFGKHFNFLGDMESEPEPGSPLDGGIEWRPSTQRSGPNFHLAAAAGKGLLIGVGSSVDFLGGDLPATVALSIEAAMVHLAAETHPTLRDVRLDPVRAV